MAAKALEGLQFSECLNSDKTVRKPYNSLQFSQRFVGRQRVRSFVSCSFHPRKAANTRKPVVLKVSCSPQNVEASALESGTLQAASFDEDVILKNKAEEVEPYLNGRCIYLVGMMGSGKTTIGRNLSEVIGYSFFDSDRLIETAVGGTSVADIFKIHGESFFRENETEVLRKVSSMQRLVISTGGGAVVRPVNWKHMRSGISVWLDVPLEALARRITAVGTDSRPLLHNEPGDAYSKTFRRLCTLWEERSEAYTNANARVSLENIAAKLGYGDVCDITPTEIVNEALVQIECFLKN